MPRTSSKDKSARSNNFKVIEQEIPKEWEDKIRKKRDRAAWIPNVKEEAFLRKWGETKTYRDLAEVLGKTYAQIEYQIKFVLRVR